MKNIDNEYNDLYLKMFNIQTNKTNEIPSKEILLPYYKPNIPNNISQEIINNLINDSNYLYYLINNYDNYIKNINKDDLKNTIIFFICQKISKCKTINELDSIYNSTKKFIKSINNNEEISKIKFINIISDYYFMNKITINDCYIIKSSFIPNFIIREYFNNKSNEYFSKDEIIDAYFYNLMLKESQCKTLNEIKDLYYKNKNIIESIIKKYGFYKFDSLIELLNSTSIDFIELGIQFNYLDNITNNNFKEKIDNIINNFNNIIYIGDIKPDLFIEYLCNLAYNKDFNEEKYYNFLFNILSQIIYKNDSIEILFKQIIINYGYFMINKLNLKNTYIFADSNITKYNNNDIDGCCLNFKIDNEYFNVINIKETKISEFDYYISVLMHEIKHATQFGYETCTLRQFKIDLDTLIKTLCEKDYNNNFTRIYSEVEAHEYGYNYAKEIINNTSIIDLEQIDYYDTQINNIKKNENNNLRYYHGKEQNIFYIYKKLLKIYKLYSFINKLSKEDIYENILPESLKLITNNNLTMKSYEEIQLLLNNCINENEKEIYEYILNNKERIRKK